MRLFLFLLSQLSDDEYGADQRIEQNEAHQHHHPRSRFHISGQIHGGDQHTAKSDKVGGYLEIQAEFFDEADQICRRDAECKKGDDPDLFFCQSSGVEGQRKGKGQQGKEPCGR